jgi:hypothetical protein
MKSRCDKASYMKGFIASSIVLVTIFILGSCLGPKKSVEEKNVLIALSNIQQSLENNASYEHFIELLGQAKSEIDILKSKRENSPCFMGAVDKCYAFYSTGRKAWQQKLIATDEARKQDMDLTLSVLQSRAALSIQMADNCFKN